MLSADEYRESIRDGRRLFFEGREVKDPTREPLFASAIEWASESYRKNYDPAEGAVGPYYKIPTSVEELRSQLTLQAEWDTLAVTTSEGLLALLTAAARLRKDLPERARTIEAYFEMCRENDLRCVQTITDAKGNRTLSPAEQDDPDLYVRVVEERPDGIVVNGAKLHISGAAVVHELIVLPTKYMKPGEEQWSVACAIPVSAPGVTILNTTNAPRSEFSRNYPYSSRRNMPEGFVVLDNVFVPNERVFLCGETRHSATFAHSLGLWQRLGGTNHMTETGDVLVGLAQLIAEANGLQRVPHIKDKIAEMVSYATLLRASLEAAIVNAKSTPEGWIYPDELFTNVAKHYGAAEFGTMIRHIHDIAGGGILTAPAIEDFENPETSELAEKYMRTMEGVSGEYRTRLFHAIRDFTADCYGGWQQVALVQSGGGLYAQRIVAAKHYDIEHAKEQAKALFDL